MKLFKRKARVVTHSGSFHADDIFAAAVLEIYFKQIDTPFKLVRTRDEKLIAKADYVFDVGGIHDPEANRFDHHQIGGAGKRDNGIPYAAFGLVWKKFGPIICGDQKMADDLDRRIVQSIDAVDNGISVSESTDCGVYEYGLHGIIGAFQNSWKECDNCRQQYRHFRKLSRFFAQALEREIKKSAHHNEMIAIIQSVYDNATDTTILEIPHHVTIGALMQVLDQHKEVLYVVARSNKNWKVLALREEPCSFGNRKSLPSAWAGKRNEALQQETGVSDAVFCHNACFLAVAESKEGAW